MSTPIHQNFPGLHNALDVLDGLQRAAQAKEQELEHELAVWSGFWGGDTHEAAVAWSRVQAAKLQHSVQAAVNYTATARQTVMDMQAQEATNAGMWL
jgi:hypothetical protein